MRVAVAMIVRASVGVAMGVGRVIVGMSMRMSV